MPPRKLPAAPAATYELSMVTCSAVQHTEKKSTLRKLTLLVERPLCIATEHVDTAVQELVSATGMEYKQTVSVQRLAANVCTLLCPGMFSEKPWLGKAKGFQFYVAARSLKQAEARIRQFWHVGPEDVDGLARCAKVQGFLRLMTEKEVAEAIASRKTVLVAQPCTLPSAPVSTPASPAHAPATKRKRGSDGRKSAHPAASGGSKQRLKHQHDSDDGKGDSDDAEDGDEDPGYDDHDHKYEGRNDDEEDDEDNDNDIDEGEGEEEDEDADDHDDHANNTATGRGSRQTSVQMSRSRSTHNTKCTSGTTAGAAAVVRRSLKSPLSRVHGRPSLHKSALDAADELDASSASDASSSSPMPVRSGRAQRYSTRRTSNNTRSQPSTFAGSPSSDHDGSADDGDYTQDAAQEDSDNASVSDLGFSDDEPMPPPAPKPRRAAPPSRR